MTEADHFDGAALREHYIWSALRELLFAAALVDAARRRRRPRRKRWVVH